MLLKAFITASSGVDELVVDEGVRFDGSFADTLGFEALDPDDVLVWPMRDKRPQPKPAASKMNRLRQGTRYLYLIEISPSSPRLFYRTLGSPSSVF